MGVFRRMNPPRERIFPLRSLRFPTLKSAIIDTGPAIRMVIGLTFETSIRILFVYHPFTESSSGAPAHGQTQ